MPRSSKESTLARQWELLRLLPSRLPGKTAKELQAALCERGFPVAKRTLERDLQLLSRVFPIECNDRSMPYQWYWERGFQAEIPGMELAEALSLGLLEEVLRLLVPATFFRGLEDRFNLARSKLRTLSKNERAKWVDLVRYIPAGLPFQPATVVSSILAVIQEGLIRCQRLRASYQSQGSGAAREMELHPLALLQQGVRSYLVATVFEFGEPLLFAMHRFEWVEATAEPAIRPEGFTLDRFLQRGGGQFGLAGPITLRARISESLARILEETPLSSDQKITQGKGFFGLSATVFDSWQLRFWILSQGPGIVVRSPAALRGEIEATIEETNAAYRSGVPGS